MARCIAPIMARGSTRKEPRLVPCGHCGYCLLNRKQDWKLRLSEEFRNSTWSWFVTLTYAPEYLPTLHSVNPLIGKHETIQNEMTLFTRHAQLFTMSLRKVNRKVYPMKQLRYYACGEYGERFGRPHYHYIIFNLHPDAAVKIPSIWKKGYCKIEPVKSLSKVANYVSGYVIKAYTKAKTLKLRPMSMMSKRPYIGQPYVQRMTEYHLRNNQPYLDLGKIKQRLPKIFKQKIWSTMQPDKLGGEWKHAPKCTLPGQLPETSRYYDPLEKLTYTPPENWKIESEIQAERLHAQRLHELKLKNGPDYNAEAYIAHEMHYNERRIFLNFKTNDQQ